MHYQLRKEKKITGEKMMSKNLKIPGGLRLQGFLGCK